MCNPEYLAARWDVCADFGRRMHRTIVHFAKAGCPDGAFSVEWPAFDAEKRQVLCMDLDPRVVSDPLGASLQFWLDASGDG